MDERPKSTPEQLEILEALRSRDETDSDPALASVAEALKQDPDLAQRLDRIVAWDARVSEAMLDVPTPPALAEQILQSLEESDDKPSPIPKVRHGNRGSRRWLAVATGVGLAAALMIIAVLGESLPTIASETLCSVARDRFVANQGNDPEGAVVSQDDPPARFPYSPDLVNVPDTRWRSVPPFKRAQVFAYDIPLGPGQKATLYVVRCRSESLPQRPPQLPQLRTQGLAIAAWQADGLVYVVAVERRDGISAEAAYRYLLKSAAHPLT